MVVPRPTEKRTVPLAHSTGTLIALSTAEECPQIDATRCMHCGQCMKVCPSGTLAEGTKGFRVQLGGKLGRHPQLARELPGVYNEKQVRQIVKDCLSFYKEHSKNGERFAQILRPGDFDTIARRYPGI